MLINFSTILARDKAQLIYIYIYIYIRFQCGSIDSLLDLTTLLFVISI